MARAGPLLHVHLWATKGKIKKLLELPALGQIRSLSLATGLTTAELATLFASGTAARRGGVDLTRNPLGLAGTTALASAGLPRLKRLRLAKCRLADNALPLLAGAPWLGKSPS